jgi:hypothetical protein
MRAIMMYWIRGGISVLHHLDEFFSLKIGRHACNPLPHGEKGFL